MSKIGATARGIVTAKPRKESKRARGEGRATAVAAKVRATDRELLAIPKSEWAHAKAQERFVKLALRGGFGFSDRGVSGLLPGHYSNRRADIHEKAKT
jgi:hypothetical protein